MVEPGEIVMFFWVHEDTDVIEMVEGVVEYLHPAGFVAVVTDLNARSEKVTVGEDGRTLLLVPKENVIAAKSSEPPPQWLENYHNTNG